jgi:hypothetical protein
VRMADPEDGMEDEESPAELVRIPDELLAEAEAIAA